MNPWTQDPSIEQRPAALLDDRRRSERTAPSQDGTQIWLDKNRRICVKVIDESPLGIGVLIPDMSFSIGPRVEIDFGGERRTATVAYLNRSTDGQYRLGLEWIKIREV